MRLPHIPQHILFPQTIPEAAEIQRALAKKVITTDQYSALNMMAGVDVSNNLYDPSQMVYAGVVNLSYPSCVRFETAYAAAKQTLAYQPGFLGFREAPVILQAFEKLKNKPDLILVDGHGISHPRRFGIATHLGILLDIPTIGVAKSILIGKPAAELGPNPGDAVPLVWHQETIGILLRSKKRANPLIISVGHRISLDSALQIVKSCLKGYRLPEATRYAHLAANHARTSASPIGNKEFLPHNQQNF
ncbi:MAG: nfi [Gammaproteobacteria bacterium]|jgi:deoxyribonuclease V|nr:nfi [Gammaproteobacteria bacterium]